MAPSQIQKKKVYSRLSTVQPYIYILFKLSPHHVVVGRVIAVAAMLGSTLRAALAHSGSATVQGGTHLGMSTGNPRVIEQ
jgi:hypothetical protein